MQERKEIEKSVIAARDCITRVGRSSTWAWNDGSRLLFWRWGESYYKEARDGAKIWVKEKLPKFTEKQRVSKDAATRLKEREKVQKVRDRRYISKGKVESVTSFFSVPKGSSDIRMVYNGTSCGLNDAVYAPWFPMPTADSHLRAVDVGTFMDDCDIGKMFLNFMLDEAMRPFAGVDLTELFKDEAKTKLF